MNKLHFLLGTFPQSIATGAYTIHLQPLPDLFYQCEHSLCIRNKGKWLPYNLERSIYFFYIFSFLFFYPFSLVSFCTTVSAKMSLLMYCCLIYKLILLSSESENGKKRTRHRSALWNTLETSIYSNTRCCDNDSLLLSVETLHYTCSFLFFFFPVWLFMCRFDYSLLPNLPFTWGLLNFYSFIVQVALNAWC